MKLNLKALAATTSILSCAAVFLVGVANLLWPPNGFNCGLPICPFRRFGVWFGDRLVVQFFYILVNMLNDT